LSDFCPWGDTLVEKAAREMEVLNIAIYLSLSKS